MEKEKSSREYVEEKKLDTQTDRLFVSFLVKAVQKNFPDVAGVYFDNQKMLVIYDPKEKIIFDKILLDSYNLTLPMEKHIQRITRVVRMVKSGIIPVYDLRTSRQGLSGFNKNKTGKLI